MIQLKFGQLCVRPTCEVQLEFGSRTRRRHQVQLEFSQLKFGQSRVKTTFEIQLEFGQSNAKTTQSPVRIQSVVYEDTLLVKRE